MSLRLATPADLPMLLAAAPDFLAAFVPGSPAVNPEKLAAGIAATIATGAVIVMLEHTKYVGSLGLERGAFWYSDEAHLREKWFHVASDRRNSRAAIALLRAAQALARARGLPLYLGSHSGYQPARLARFCERMGGELLGSAFRF